MRNFFRSNNFYKILSIVLAFILWFYVNERQNPVAEHVINVPLEIQNLSTELVVSEKPDTVQVRFKGRHQVVEKTAPREFNAYVDLKKASVGNNLLPVSVNAPDTVELVEVYPDKVNIVVEKVSEIQIPLVVEQKGSTAPTYISLDPIVRPTKVSVSGPQHILEELGEAYVAVELQQQKTNYSEWLPVKVRNRKGEDVGQWVRIEPGVAHVFIPVIKDKPDKLLPLTVEITGKPAPGYQVERIIVEPASVAVYGPPELLDKYDQLQLGTVDVSGSRGNIAVEKELQLPQGLAWEDKQTVLVVVVITPV